jgi:RNA polymerase sigma factor (sigma-70 family)
VSTSSTPESPPVAEQTRWFSEEVQPHEGALRNFLRRRVSSAADIDDVVQDSYVKILQARSAGEIVSIKAYLFTIARNTAAKVFRKRKIFSATPVSELPSWRVLDREQDVIEAVNHRAQQALIAEAIAELPERCREILLLRIVDDVSRPEIAMRLNIAESTVRTQLARGLEKCTNSLRKRGVTPET